ncbi:MAG: HlyD family efflux transporter periplasmic adaptor subunit [Steroidobacteraceae bacterium]
MPEPSVPPRARRARTVWIVAVATVVAGLAWAFWPRPVEADLATVDRGEVTVELVDEGRTRMHDVYVIAAPVAGRLLRVEVEPGDPVAAGAVVARIARAPAGFLDTRTDLQARAQVDAAAAALRSAEASLALAQREHERVQKLEAAKLVSVAAVDEVRTRLDAARAARDAAQADLVRARSALQSPASATAGIVTVRAPSAGKVLRVPQKSEAVVAAGTPLVELGDDRHVEVVAEFLSQDAVRMAPGNEALIENWRRRHRRCGRCRPIQRRLAGVPPPGAALRLAPRACGPAERGARARHARRDRGIAAHAGPARGRCTRRAGRGLGAAALGAAPGRLGGAAAGRPQWR